MSEIIAYCGIRCDQCPAYIATQSDDDEARATVAAEWSRLYNHKFQPAQINCDGCITPSGRKFVHCNVCEVRDCAMDREVENCAHCEDFACTRVKEILDMVPDAEAVLKKIKAEL